MRGRPEFISREDFRQYLTLCRINKIMSIGGIQPSSYTSRRIREGRPIKTIDGKYRPLDLVAAARAECLTVAKPKQQQMLDNCSDLEKRLSSLKAQLEKAEQSKVLFSAVNHAGYTNKLLAPEEIVLKSGRHTPSVGVYFLIHKDSIVYVGQSKNVFSRVATHANEGVKVFDRWCYIECEEGQLDLVESLYIHTIRPKMNIHSINNYLVAPLTFDQCFSESLRRNDKGAA